jgi:hypothetical protein
MIFQGMTAGAWARRLPADRIGDEPGRRQTAFPADSLVSPDPRNFCFAGAGKDVQQNDFP